MRINTIQLKKRKVKRRVINNNNNKKKKNKDLIDEMNDKDK
jgi:hypothetical protein